MGQRPCSGSRASRVTGAFLVHLQPPSAVMPGGPLTANDTGHFQDAARMDMIADATSARLTLGWTCMLPRHAGGHAHTLCGVHTCRE